MRTKIEFEGILRDLVNEIGGDLVHTIQFISAARTYSDDLIRLHLSCNLEVYNKMTKEYLVDTNYINSITPILDKDIKQSLAFLAPSQPYMYFQYVNESKTIKLNEGLKSDPNDPINFSISDEKRKELESLKPEKVWQKWGDILKHYELGKATMWINLKSNIPLIKPFVSSIVLILNEDINQEEKRNISKIVQDFLHNQILHIYSSELIQKTTRSAISQVMARNMSHNIGSHVLSSISSEGTIQEILKKNLYDPKCFDYAREFGVNDCKECSELYKQIAIFNSYLKTMMDFLADVATSTPTAEIPKYLRNDVFRGFAQNFILRNYISGTDDFKYYFEFKINGKTLNSADTDDILISMPNDVLGSHAFYIIIKNIIRNTAKHSGGVRSILIRSENNPLQKVIKEKTKEDYIVFTIEINEFKEDTSLYEVKIYDNVPKEDIEALVTARNKQLNGSILDTETFELRSSGGWGLIEMDVCAAYMRMIPIEDVEDKKYNVKESANNESYSSGTETSDWNILRAIHQDGCLGYRFFMMKPKEVLVVDASENFYDSFNKTQEPNQFKTLLNNGVLIEKPSSEWYIQAPVYAHPFLVYVSSETNKQPEYIKQLINANHGNLPNRVIAVIDGSESFFAPDGLPNIPDRNIAYISREVYNDQVCPAIQMIAEGHKEGLEGLKKLLYKLWLRNRYAALGIKSFSCVNRRLKSTSNDIIKIDRTNGEYNFRFDHHGDKISPTVMAHYEAYGSIVKNWTELGFGKVTDDSKWESVNSVYYGIVDSALQNVVIIDERVQKRSSESIYTKTYIELLKWTNIHIPSKYEVDLNSTSFEGTHGKLITWLKTICTSPTTLKHSSGQVLTIPTDEEKYVDFKGVDFCVIHLGIIEKLIKADSKQKDSSKSSEVASFVDKTLRPVVGDSCKIIIISGRGRPSNLPDDIPYLNFSIVSQYCFDQKLKFLLTNGLSNARNLKSK